jgi:hypothetical protein
MNDVVEVAIQPEGGYVVARLSGQLSLQTVATTRHTLTELLGRAGCVVADLSGLQLRDPETVAVFSAAVQQAGGWPRAKLALFGTRPRMLAELRSLRVREAVPVADGSGRRPRRSQSAAWCLAVGRHRDRRARYRRRA